MRCITFWMPFIYALRIVRLISPALTLSTLSTCLELGLVQLQPGINRWVGWLNECWVLRTTQGRSGVRSPKIAFINQSEVAAGMSVQPSIKVPPPLGECVGEVSYSPRPETRWGVYGRYCNFKSGESRRRRRRRRMYALFELIQRMKGGLYLSKRMNVLLRQ